MDMKIVTKYKSIRERCKFFTPGTDKGTCDNEGSVYYQVKVSKYNRCWRGAAK